MKRDAEQNSIGKSDEQIRLHAKKRAGRDCFIFEQGDQLTAKTRNASPPKFFIAPTAQSRKNICHLPKNARWLLERKSSVKYCYFRSTPIGPLPTFPEHLWLSPRHFIGANRETERWHDFGREARLELRAKWSSLSYNYVQDVMARCQRWKIAWIEHSNKRAYLRMDAVWHDKRMGNDRIVTRGRRSNCELCRDHRCHCLLALKHEWRMNRIRVEVAWNVCMLNGLGCCCLF